MIPSIFQHLFQQFYSFLFFIFPFFHLFFPFSSSQGLNDPSSHYVEGRLGGRRIWWCPSGYGYLAYCPQPTDWDNYNWCCTFPYMGSWQVFLAFKFIFFLNFGVIKILESSEASGLEIGPK